MENELKIYVQDENVREKFCESLCNINKKYSRKLNEKIKIIFEQIGISSYIKGSCCNDDEFRFKILEDEKIY